MTHTRPPCAAAIPAIALLFQSVRPVAAVAGVEAMMGLYSFSTIVIIASAIFYYRAAQFEGKSGLLWVTLSVLISIATWKWLGWGMAGIFFGQVALFVGITLLRSNHQP